MTSVGYAINTPEMKKLNIAMELLGNVCQA